MVNNKIEWKEIYDVNGSLHYICELDNIIFDAKEIVYNNYPDSYEDTMYELSYKLNIKSINENSNLYKKLSTIENIINEFKRSGRNSLEYKIDRILDLLSPPAEVSSDPIDMGF